MTKKELMEYYRNLIYKVGLCQSVKSSHLNLYFELMDLFTNHPDYPEKIKDVVDISIVKNKLNHKYLELQILKMDNTTDNISYRCCINKPSKNRDLKNAMRYAILPQIKEFRNNCQILECSICKSSDNVEIDHIILFNRLYDGFIKDRADIPTSYDDNYYNSAVFKADDKPFENDWIDYHMKNSILRCLCKTCNLKRERK
jgi:hypothetical protein